MNNFIGTVLYGHCRGFFGRDHYSRATIEAQGKDWVVVRDEEGFVHFAEFVNWEDRMERLLTEWSNPTNE